MLNSSGRGAQSRAEYSGYNVTLYFTYDTYNLGNAYIIGGFPMLSERQRMCKETGAREVYIECPRELAEERAEAMGKGTADVWKKYIAEWFEKYTPPAAE